MNTSKDYYTCNYCNKEFEGKRSRKNKFCSSECHYASKRKGDVKNECLNCHEKFTVPYKKRDRKYCSRKCYNDYRTDDPLYKSCELCGKEYQVRNKSNFERSKYCSSKCLQISNGLKSVGKKISKENLGRNVECNSCNKKFYLSMNRIKTNKTGNFFCSHKCRRTGKKVDCKNCGEYFYQTKSKKYRFCSRECRHDYHTIKRYCINCGAQFTAPKSSTDRDFHCSIECRHQSQRNKYKKTRNLRRKISSRKYARYQSENCTNVYVRNYLKYKHNLNKIPGSVVQAKKLHIKIKRLIKSNKQ